MANVINYNPEENRREYSLGGTDRKLYLDLADLNFPQRYQEARINIENYFKKVSKEHGVNTDNLDELSLNKAMENGTPEENYQIVVEGDKFVREQLNNAFDYDVSSIVFGSANCLTTTKQGNYYFEDFVMAMMPVIEAEYKVRLDVMKKRLKKFTSQKGKYSK